MLPFEKEMNFDGLVGPTHNYSGLSWGNLASSLSENQVSNPKQSALQGLEKMWFLAQLGIPQGVLPPHERPHIPTLRTLGFLGTDTHIPEKVYLADPKLLAVTSSASSMWAANEATVTPSSDTVDEKVHFTPSNQCTNSHRAIEAKMTGRILEKIFHDPTYFVHHPPLPTGQLFSDEGAANHIRFCRQYADLGIHLFVYGRKGFEKKQYGQLPSRQTEQAGQSIARSHQLFEDRVLFARQNQEAIDRGVFHNDVISLGNQHVFIYHELAFERKETLLKTLEKKLETYCQVHPLLIEVKESQVPLETAVKTYLFNSQLITYEDAGMSLIAPKECEKDRYVSAFLKKMTEDPENPIRDIHFVDVLQSMKNGGGPACLRLQVILTENELQGMQESVLLTEKLYVNLKNWIEKHYRSTLVLKDIADPKFIEETRKALDELTSLLHLGSIYSFQKSSP